MRADGVLTGRSEVLALELRLYPDDRFRFYDPVSGQDLPSLEESEAAREALETRLQRLERRLHRAGQESDDLEDGR